MLFVVFRSAKARTFAERKATLAASCSFVAPLGQVSTPPGAAILPGRTPPRGHAVISGHVGGFQGKIDVTVQLQEERHLRKGRGHGQVLQVGFRHPIGNVGRQGERFAVREQIGIFVEPFPNRPVHTPRVVHRRAEPGPPRLGEYPGARPFPPCPRTAGRSRGGPCSQATPSPRARQLGRRSRGGSSASPHLTRGGRHGEFVADPRRRFRDRQAAFSFRRRCGRGGRPQRQDVGNNPPAVLLGHGIVAGRQKAAIERLAEMGDPAQVKGVKRFRVHPCPVGNGHLLHSPMTLPFYDNSIPSPAWNQGVSGPRAALWLPV